MTHLGSLALWGALIYCCVSGGVAFGQVDSPTSGTSVGTSELATTSPVVSGGYQAIGFDILGGYEYPEDGVAATSDTVAKNLIPDRIRALDGRRVQVEGFMIPLDSSDGKVSTFLLQGNQMQCCYGVPPRINEVVLVRTKQAGFTYTADSPVKVQGTLHVGEVRDQGSLMGLYALDADEISD